MKSIAAITCKGMIAILAIALATVPVFASEGNWKLDSNHSTVRIFLGANAANIGVARVSGKAELNATEPASSAFDLRIAPSEDNVMTFKSRRVSMEPDGRLEVTGDLTLTRVERQMILNPGEDYSGPVYGDPITRTATREVTFVLSTGALEAAGEITAESKLYRENFPELFAGLTESNWQPVVQNESCDMPVAAEDYSGAACTGTVIEPIRSAPAASIGEDYHGFESVAPQGDLMRIVLHLRLNREAAERALAGN